MNRIRHLPLITAVALLLGACGGSEGPSNAIDEPKLDTITDEIGRIEQDFVDDNTASVAGISRWLGVVTNSAAGCSPAGVGASNVLGSGCNVLIPGNKRTLTVGIVPSQENAQLRSAISNVVNSINSQGHFATWSLTPVGSNGADLVFQNLHLNDFGAGATDIRSYASFSCSAGNFVSGPGPGTYRIMSGCLDVVDITKINAVPGLTSAQKANLTQHAVAHELIKMIGIGSTGNPAEPNQVASSTVINVQTTKKLLIAAQECLVSTYAFGDLASYVLTPGVCPAFPSGI